MYSLSLVVRIDGEIQPTITLSLAIGKLLRGCFVILHTGLDVARWSQESLGIA
jgi:hypothetical protein